MPTGVGYGRRYTAEERQEILSALKNYRTLGEAALGLGVSENTLSVWRRKYGLSEQRKNEKKKQKKKLIKKSLKYKSAAEAARKLSASEMSIRSWQKTAGVYTPDKRHSKQERNKYVEASLRYETTIEAARELGVNYGSLLRWRVEKGIRPTRRVWREYTEAQKLHFAEESVKYDNLSQARNHLGISHGALKSYCKKFGVPIKDNKKRYSAEEKIECADRMRNGTKVLSLAREKNISTGLLYRWHKLDAEGKLK